MSTVGRVAGNSGTSCVSPAPRGDAGSRERLGAPAAYHSHGVSGYKKWGCRCDICREARAEHDWWYRQRHPKPPPRNPRPGLPYPFAEFAAATRGRG